MHMDEQAVPATPAGAAVAAVSRRGFLSLSAGAGAALALGGGAPAGVAAVPAETAAAAAALPAGRPRPPYRVWAGPDFLARNPDHYAAMMLDASGHLDPRVAGLLGKLVLDTIDGTQTPNARGPYYWKNACDAVRRTRDAVGGRPAVVSSGLAVRTWGGPPPEKKPDNEKWMLEGLREGKKANPDCFLAAWISEPNGRMFEAGRDGLIDLFIVEGFTHAAPGAAEEGQAVTALPWERAVARCDAFRDAGLIGKTILCFGQVRADAAAGDGAKMNKEWLGARARELKRRHPDMPGVAFWQATDVRTGNMDLVRFCDQLSSELWPAAGAG